MGFASAWLNEKALFPEFIKEPPEKETGIIVVVPAYSEPGIADLLNSLAECSKPGCAVEIIVVVNAPSNAPQEHIESNKATLSDIESWKKEHKPFFRLFALHVEHSFRDWGVGMARKTGMDEALRRFSVLNNPEGLILSLDADCKVSKNYFLSAYSDFYLKKDKTACSVYFEHPLSGNDFPEATYNSIAQYELHLRYLYQGLLFAGFPYVFHTVGSSMGVKAMTYLKSGGMNRKQAGEDFYFIQKLVSSSGYFSMNSASVFPSPRTSFRVPFGTGASMGKLSEADNQVLLTYNPRAFDELRSAFMMTDKLHQCNLDEPGRHYASMPKGVRSFVDESEWIDRMAEIRNNTSTSESFKKRFFSWFNLFKTIKYLNYVHRETFSKMPVTEAAASLLKMTDRQVPSSDTIDLLRFYRSLEKGS
jgi:hypothetical protein